MNTNDPTQSHTRGKPKNKVTIDWTTISKEMKRQYQSCVVRIYMYVIFIFNFYLYLYLLSIL